MTTLLGNGMELVEPVKVEPVFGEPARPDTPKLTIVNSAPQPSQKSDALVAPNDRPYTVNDLMVLHNLSRSTVIRLYENEPDVMVLQASREHQRKIGRRYRTIRVPPKVYRRVKQRMENR